MVSLLCFKSACVCVCVYVCFLPKLDYIFLGGGPGGKFSRPLCHLYCIDKVWTCDE